MPEKSVKNDMNWDLTSYFPEFNGTKMKKFKKSLVEDIESARKKASKLSTLTDKNAKQWREIFLKGEDILKRLGHLESYVSCLVSSDARNEDYVKESASMANILANFSKLETELMRAIKKSSKKVFSKFANHTIFQGAKHYLTRLKEQARYTMETEKEMLAADLGVDGINAWGRLYDTISGKIEFTMTYPDGRCERVPMSQRRSFLEDTDRRIRQSAFEGGNSAWQSVEDVASAALNAISGTRLTLNQHRKIDHFLNVALFQSAITKKSLDAMFDAVYSNIEVSRRILKLKAKTLGLKAVAWYDLSAPLPIKDQEHAPWNKGKTIVKESFSRTYPELRNYMQTMYEKRWVEVEPRAGKVPGAFCTGSNLTKESRIFMTYKGSLGDILTLAHEAGHAFHHFVMRDLRPYAHHYPMTLAESASTFGENILKDGLLENPDISDEKKALILDMEISHGAIYLLDIPVRFEFEKKLYEERAQGELSVSRLKELMVENQRRIFGDVLEKGGEDPLFWASKLHFYITGLTFYNFPYTFGYLLSRGLFEMFKKEGANFLKKYEEFLCLAGSDTAINVVRKCIGQNLEKPDFWTESIRSLEKPLKQLEELLPKVLPSLK